MCPPFCINYSLHPPWHTFIEVSQVLGSYVCPNLASNFFQAFFWGSAFFALHVLHLTPKVFNWFAVGAITRPSLGKFDAMICMPLFHWDDPVGRQRKQKLKSKFLVITFSLFIKMTLSLSFALISKQIKAEMWDWSRSIDFSQRISKLFSRLKSDGN